MKKYFFLFSVMVVMTMCLGFSSCSKDDDGGGSNYKGNGNLEVTVNGKSYKYNDILGAQIGLIGNSLFIRNLGEIETPDADLIFNLSFYINEKDFKNAKAGEFKIGDYFSTPQNFDLSIEVTTDGGGWYAYVSGGKHSVSNVKLLSTDKSSGIITYLVEGTFSCSFKHNTNGKTLEMSGKYWTKLEVNPESKL